MNEVIFEEYDRLHYNYDVCLKAFEEIVNLSFENGYFCISDIIRRTLRELKPIPPKEDLGNEDL